MSMTPKQLKTRIFFKEATPVHKRNIVKKFSRRESNTSLKVEDHPNDEFESFFEFEEDLSELKSASSQYAENNLDNESPVSTLNIDKTSISVLEKDSLYSNKKEYDNNLDLESSANKIGILVEENTGVDFTKCEFSDSNNKVCSSKKTKGSIYCKKHKELLIENIKKSNGL